MDDINIISFSGGRTSAYMTLKLLEDKNYNEDNTVICFANTGKEVEGTLKFVRDFDDYIGGKIMWIEYDNLFNTETEKFKHTFKTVSYISASRDGEPFAKLIKARRFVPNVVSRYCTQELKIRPIKKFMQWLGYKHWNNLVGIRYDEPKRYFNLLNNSSKEVWESKAPLFDMKVTKQDVIEFWNKMPFNLEIADLEGNCDLCFLKGMSKKIRILQQHPEKAKWWIEQEKITGATFVKHAPMQSILDKASKQMQILYDDADYGDCFCNID